jgi:hypothetical protein
MKKLLSYLIYSELYHREKGDAIRKRRRKRKNSLDVRSCFVYDTNIEKEGEYAPSDEIAGQTLFSDPKGEENHRASAV